MHPMSRGLLLSSLVNEKFQPCLGMVADCVLGGRRYFGDDISAKPAVTHNERARAVTSFYYQSAIDQAAAKVGQTMQSQLMVVGLNESLCSYYCLKYYAAEKYNSERRIFSG